jgi:hypothetical protein
LEMLEKRARSSACRNCRYFAHLTHPLPTPNYFLLQGKLLTTRPRIRKRKCLTNPSDEDGNCQLCKQQSIPCSLTRRIRQTRPIVCADDQLSPATTSCATASCVPSDGPVLPIPPRPVLGELVELYFRFMHDGPHTLFHEPTFLSRLAQNMVPSFLLLAMISLSSR